VRGLLDTATRIGFPTPQGAIEQLANFVNGIISAVINAIVGIWNVLVNFVGSVANFVMTVWNNVVGPVLGAAIEAVKTVVMFEIELVKTFISTILNTPSSTVNPEETKIYVTQQLFKQNVMQSYQGDYDPQPPVDIFTDPFETLMNIMPVLQPLMQIGSIGALLTSFVQIPPLIVELINILGSGGVMSIMFEIINI
jgi:phage-related protein